MTVFRKNVNCPSSEKLLAFQTGAISVRERDKIVVHLRFCEFCAAETDFYTHHPQADDAIEKADIPTPLYELAEALLSDKKKECLEQLFSKDNL